jgi:hypothetical protein
MERLRQNLADQETAHATLESIRSKGTEVADMEWQRRAATLHELTIHELEKFAVILEEEAEGAVSKRSTLRVSGGSTSKLTLLALKAIDQHYEKLLTEKTTELVKFAYKNSDIGLLQLLKENYSEMDEIKIDLSSAAEAGKAEIVRMMLDDPYLCDDDTDYSRALRIAAARGHAVIVEMLLVDRRANPRICNSDALSWAAIYGHQRVIDLLLADGRVNPKALQDLTGRSNL